MLIIKLLVRRDYSYCTVASDFSYTGYPLMNACFAMEVRKSTERLRCLLLFSF